MFTSSNLKKYVVSIVVQFHKKTNSCITYLSQCLLIPSLKC